MSIRARYQAPQAVQELATLVRDTSRLAQEDLIVMAASVDAGEQEWNWSGLVVWQALRAAADQLELSAADVMDQVLTELGEL